MKTFISASCAVALASSSFAAAPFIETFSLENDTAGWFELPVADATTFGQNPATGALDFSATNFSLYYIIADAAASSGAFSGDYTAAGLDSASFDLAIAGGSGVENVYIELSNFSEGESWLYQLTPTINGGFVSYVVPIDSFGTGWTQTAGDASFSFLLGNVEEFAIALEGSGDLTASVDNIQIVPEPASAALLLTGLLAMGARRRRTA